MTEVVRVIQAVSRKVMRVLTGDQLRPEAGDVGKSHPFASQSGEGRPVFFKPRRNDPAAFRRWQHGGDDHELHVCDLIADTPHHARDVLDELAGLGAARVVHAEGDDHQVGLQGSDTRGVRQPVGGRPSSGRQVVQLNWRTVLLLERDRNQLSERGLIRWHLVKPRHIVAFRNAVAGQTDRHRLPAFQSRGHAGKGARSAGRPPGPWIARMGVCHGDESVVQQHPVCGSDRLPICFWHARPWRSHDSPGSAVDEVVGAFDVGDVCGDARHGQDHIGRKEKAALSRAVRACEEYDALGVHRP